MHFKRLIAIPILFFAACTATDEEIAVTPPEDLLPEVKIMDIIIDLQILESHYQFRYQRPDVYKNALDSASYYVYQKHGTNEDQYVRSFNYYAHDIDKMYLIYEATLDSVNLLLTEQQQLMQEQQ
jgi:hypothetical protein